MKRVWISSTVMVVALVMGIVFYRVSTVREIGRIEALEGRTGAFAELARPLPIGFYDVASWSSNSLETARIEMGLPTLSNLYVVRFRDNGLPAFDGYAAYDTNKQTMVRAVVFQLPNETRVPARICVVIFYAAAGLLFYSVLCLLTAPFLKRMRLWIMRHWISHLLCVLFVIYCLLGWRFYYTHTTGGSYMVTHAVTTHTERVLVNVFRPFFIFCLGFTVDPVEWDVGYHDMAPAPRVSLTSSGFTLHLGIITNASFSDYNMHADEYPSDSDKIYVYCRMSRRGKHRQDFNMEFPAGNGWKFEPQSVKLIWMDPDGVEVPIQIIR